MEIMELKEFFTYKPVETDPQYLVDEIIARASSYIHGKDLEKIQLAYEFAEKAHGTGQRLSGEQYIIHPLQATLFLMALKPDLATIQACILHDVLEDTDVEVQEITQEFGTEVAELCEGMVKVSKVKYHGEERQLETLKKTFLAMGKDLRVIFIKLADRVHNIQTLHYHPKEEKRRRIAEETLKVYVPIAKRLGLYYYQQLLENGSFRILYPKEFTIIITYLDKNFSYQSDIISEGVKKLQLLLSSDHVPFYSIIGRVKSPYRIWEKMTHKYQSMDFSNITDMIAFRIVTKTVGDCYNILGVIHHNFTPLIKKIKDYIAVPKFNDYKSLHTTVLGLYDYPVEIQIRTQEMNEIADWGVAAHFAYTEKKGSTSVNERQSLWIKKLQELVSSYTTNDDKESFKNELNIELLEPNIFVYTQKGDIIELPVGSSVLDFAFRIHSDLGLKFQSALVNGAIVPISHKLKTGDIVIIHAFKNKWSASGNWFEYLHTPSAKSKLTKFVKQKEKQQLIAKSARLLDEKLKEYKLPLLHAKNDLITKEYKGEYLERILLQLLDKQLGYITFIKKYYKDQIPDEKPKKGQKQLISETSRPEVVIDGGLRLGYVLCPECKPTIDDKIIARSGKDGLKIHSIDCKGVKTVSLEKLLEAHWSTKDVTHYQYDLVLQCQDRPGVLLDLFRIFTTLSLNIQKITSESVEETVQNVFITVESTHPSKISYLLQELKKRSTTMKIMKKHIS